MSYQLIGKLYKKFETEQKTDSFQAREFVVESQGQYPQFVKFQLVQDRCSEIDKIEEGEELTVHFDLRGREWNGKFFTNLNAWRIEKKMLKNEENVNQNFPAEEPPYMNNTEKDDIVTEDLDDLPF